LRVATYVWQLTRDYPAAEADDRRLPLSEVWFKTHDGPTWMGHYDAHPHAPRSAGSLGDLVRSYAARGLAFVPWCVPSGEDLAAEAELAMCVLDALVAAGAPPRLAFDVEVEDTPNFWKGSPSDLLDLVGRVRSGHPTAELTLVVYQDAEIGLSQIAPAFDVLSSMDYWPQYATQPEAQLQSSHDRLARFGKPIVYGLPGDAPWPELSAALHWVHAHHSRHVLWRRGLIPRETWDHIRSLNL
jgi:hypothetical protein